MTFESGLKYNDGTPIEINDVVEFKFDSFIGTPFIGSSIGKLITEHNISGCFFHFKLARDFQPNYGWHTTILYVVYMIKDGELFKEFAEDGEVDKDSENYNFFSVDPRFLVYMQSKNEFYFSSNSEKRILDLEDLIKD